MLTERLQILITAEQRRRLEDEAKRRGVSAGSLVREALDAKFGGITTAERLAALEHLRTLSAPYYPPEELNKLIDDTRDPMVDDRWC